MVNIKSMKSINLARTPPRSPRERLGGLLMLARTIDKLRAELPEGDLGQYKLEGFSTRLLNALNITPAALREVVEQADDDNAVVAWVHAHSDRATYDAINDGFSSKRISDFANDPTYFDRYPVAKELPPETTHLEVLEYDDCALFLQ